MNSLLKKASEAYYAGEPFLSDEEFDSLAKISNYTSVGASAPSNKIRHFFRMYSLEKCYEGEEPPLPFVDCIESPKLDGAAVALLYVDGKLVQAATRGDGVEGTDILEKMEYLVPTSTTPVAKIMQITGEVVAPTTIPNSRNYAAGALNLKSLEEFRTREVRFFAYGLQTPAPVYRDWESAMAALYTQGFNTVLQDTSNYPTDGLVYRLNNFKDFEKAGYTASHPKGAFALKKRSEGVVSFLREVIWQVGRTGVISPVGILDPVKVGDALVSRVTLHNMQFIESLDLEIGCAVEVIRAGEIIPRIVRKLPKNNS